MIKITFDNLTLFTINAITTCILLLLIKYIKIKPKKAYYLKLLSIFFLITSISVPNVLHNHNNDKQAFLIDISNSMPSDDIYKRVKKLYKNDSKIFLFSEKITPFSISLNELKNLNELKRTWNKLNLNKTYIKNNIEQLINANDAKKIFLYTDGYETGNALEEFLLNSHFNAKIYPLIPDFSNQQSNIEDSITLKTTYNPKGTLNKSEILRLIISNRSNENKNITIKVSQENKIISNDKIILSKNDITTKDITTTILNKSLNKITIELLDENKLIEKKTLHITATKKDNILLISNSLQDSNFIETIINKLGYNLTSIHNIDGKSFNNINNYSLIILNNVPYNKLGNDNAYQISNFVKKGGKFLMIGGEHSFGLGGYKNTYIEEILPVIFDDPQKEIKRANLGLALILDNSLSMQEGKKIDYLKIASKNLIKNLNDNDYLGIIGFNTNSFTLFPINKMKDHRNTALKSLDNISIFGGTNLMPAINDAINMLSKVKTGKKHIILLTDGEVPGHVKKFADVALTIRMIGSTLSTVLLGKNTYDKLLKEMAKVGNGNYYTANNESLLPNIFIEDLNFIKDSKDIKENIFKIKSNRLKNTYYNEFPIIKGIVNTKPKKNSNVELIASNFSTDIPLLVSHNIEQGKAVAFMTDMNGRWSKEWIEWEDIFTFWEQVFSHILYDNYKQEYNILDYDLSYYILNNNLYFDINIFKNILFNELSLELVLPNKSIQKLELKKLALGHYNAQFESPIKGTYKVYLRYKEKKEVPIIFSLNESDTTEEKHFRANMHLLNLLANKHFAKINPKTFDLKQNDFFYNKKNISLYFLILSLTCFLCSIYKREQ